MVPYPLPPVAVGHSTPLVFSRNPEILLAVLSSFVLDFVLRQKLGGVNLTYNYVQQLPMPNPEIFDAPVSFSGGETLRDWICFRVLRLAYTAVDLEGLGRSLGAAEPHPFDADEREILRAELDGLMFHLYGVSRDDVDYILETFPIVKRKDEKAHGEFRTKRLILEAYDRLAPDLREPESNREMS